MPNGVFSIFQSSLTNFFCTYSTVKQIKVYNTYVGVINRILQLVVGFYIAFYIVWIRKGYQDVDEPRGSSVIKVKGVARVSIDNLDLSADKVQQSLWDTPEYLIPPIENNAFFIATRKTVTYDQTLGVCPSSLNDNLSCNSTYNPCKKGIPSPGSFDFLTGNCVSNKKNMPKTVCEINAWCPQELDNSTDYKIDIDDLKTFTVFIKTIVVFSQHNIKIRTVKNNTNFSCQFNNETAQRCPIFSMGYILQQIHDHDSKINFPSLYHQGGLIEIQQKWKCNFDAPGEEKECFPTFTFNLLQSGSDEQSPGINYRYAEKHILNGKEYRTLYKVYGLRFILSIRGEGRRFDIVRLFVAFGSGVGYMIIAKIICEFIFMKFHKYRANYIQNKVEKFRLSDMNKHDSMKLTTINSPTVEQPLTSSQIDKSVV